MSYQVFVRGSRGGGGAAIKARPHPDIRSNIVREGEVKREEDSSGPVSSARLSVAGLAALMTILHSLYSALLGMCDYWIRLCEYKPLLCCSAVSEA